MCSRGVLKQPLIIESMPFSFPGASSPPKPGRGLTEVVEDRLVVDFTGWDPNIETNDS